MRPQHAAMSLLREMLYVLDASERVGNAADRKAADRLQVSSAGHPPRQTTNYSTLHMHHLTASSTMHMHSIWQPINCTWPVRVSNKYHQQQAHHANAPPFGHCCCRKSGVCARRGRCCTITANPHS